MTIIAKYKIDDDQIKDMSMTISLTMTVKEWREIMRTKTQAQLYEPFSKVQNIISAALGDLNKAVEKEYKKDEWLRRNDT